MARQKQKAPVERQSAQIGISLVPAYAIEFDHSALRGHTAIAVTPEKAMIAARSLIASKFPMSHFDVDVIEKTPERFTKVDVHFDPS